jgi:RES domain-containing protein
MGTIFRSAPPKWASSKNIISGHGSFRSGARFNAPGSFPAVYGSTTPELAMTESLVYQRDAAYPPQYALPLVFKAIEVCVQKMLTLTKTGILDALSLTLDDILKDQWRHARARGEESISQALGRAVRTCGVGALAVPSAHAADRGVNVVLFSDNLAVGSLKVLRGRSGR